MLADAGKKAPLGDQHRGEEDQQQDLGELGGLNREPREANPDLGAVLFGQRGRQQSGNHQEYQADQSTDVAVAGELSMVFEEGDHQCEGHHTDQGPQHLLSGARVVTAAELIGHQIQPVNHDQPKSVEQCHNWQQQGVGVGRKSPDGHVRGSEDDQEHQSVADRVPAQIVLLVGFNDQQRGHGDGGGEAQQQQLGVAPGGQQGRDRDRRLKLCGHATVRQSMPG